MRVLRILWLSVLVVALTACSGSNAKKDSSDGILRFGFSVGPPTLDPDLLSSTVFNTFLYPVYDSLLWTNVDGEIEPMLATSYKVGADGRSIELQLIEDWKFHDGAPFDAAAVKSNLERSKTVAGSVTAKELTSVESVEVVNPLTVRIMLNKPTSGPVINALASNAGMMISPKALGNADLDVNPIGSGQFKLTENILDEKISYRAVDGYWDKGVGELKGIDFYLTSDDKVRLNQLISGETNAAFLRPGQGAEATSAGLSIIDDKATLTTYSMYINSKRNKFSDVRVRQAFEHAINKDAIGNGLHEGWCKPTTQYYAGFHWAASKDVKPIAYDYDPEKAKALLKEAGVGEGFTFVAAVDALPIFVKMAELVQQDLKAIGVTMKIEPLENAAVQEQFQAGKKYDAAVIVLSPPADPSGLVDLLLRKDSPWNPGGFESEELAETARQALEAPDVKERGQLYGKIMEATVRDAYPGVHLCNNTVPLVHNKEVMGLQLSFDGTRKFRGVTIEK